MGTGADRNGEIVGRAWQSRTSTSDTVLLRYVITTAAGRCVRCLQLHIVRTLSTSCLAAVLTDSPTSGTALGLRSRSPPQRVRSLCEN